MATIKCSQCGYENPEGSTICEICAEELVKTEKAEPICITPPVSVENTTGSTEYYVICPESHAKTIVSDDSLTSFFCEGCKKTHEIDGFLWVIESRVKDDNTVENTQAQAQVSTTGDSLWLEEINSHYRIDIDKAGGALGRYGKYGAEFFQSRSMMTVSGEHCNISYELDNWVLRHKSKTNQTKYNNMILANDEPYILEDGKMLTLANTVTFVVRIR